MCAIVPPRMPLVVQIRAGAIRFCFGQCVQSLLWAIGARGTELNCDGRLLDKNAHGIIQRMWREGMVTA